MRSLIEKSVGAGRHLAIWLVWQATGTSLVQDRTPDDAMLGAPFTSCPRTGLAVPECSCPRCIEDQVRRHRPELFRRPHAA